MGMSLTTYVGPYLIVPRGFEWWKFDNIVADGRGEAGVGENVVILVPNQELEGVTRPMRVDRTGDQEMCQINPAMIVRETSAFIRLAKPVLQYCDDYGIEIQEGWGVVPCWS